MWVITGMAQVGPKKCDDEPEVIRSLLTLTRPFRRDDIVRMAPPLLRGPFTVGAYHRLAELGVLDEDDRVELLDGQIVEMTPIGAAHAACVIRLTALLSRRMGGDTCVSVQNTHASPARNRMPRHATLR